MIRDVDEKITQLKSETTTITIMDCGKLIQGTLLFTIISYSMFNCL